MNTRTLLLTAGLLVASMAGLEGVASAAPPPGPAMDPSKMSGMPRPDPKLAPGVVTVRCLVGGFDKPAIDVEVTLEVATADGPVTRTAKTIEQGRATFEGLLPLHGTSFVAIGAYALPQAAPERSSPGPADMGIALLLVAPAEPGANGQAPPTPGGYRPS